MELTEQCKNQLEQFGEFGEYLKQRAELYLKNGNETYFESKELKRLWYLVKVEALSTYLMTPTGHYDDVAKRKLKVLLNYGARLFEKASFIPKCNNVLQDTKNEC